MTYAAVLIHGFTPLPLTFNVGPVALRGTGELDLAQTPEPTAEVPAPMKGAAEGNDGKPNRLIEAEPST